MALQNAVVPFWFRMPVTLCKSPTLDQEKEACLCYEAPTARGLLKTGRRSYGPMNQNLKSSVHHAGFLYAVEEAKGWFLSV